MNSSAYALTGMLEPLDSKEVRVYTLNTGHRETIRAAARAILGALLGIEPAKLVFTSTGEGKPLLRDFPDMHYSVSHTDALALIAVTRCAPVGVDVEKIRAVPNAETILRRFFPVHVRDEVFATADGQDERFMQAWTRAEAVVKVRGGSVWDMARIDPNVVVRNIPVMNGYAAAIAVLSSEWSVTRYDYYPRSHETRAIESFRP